MRWTLPDAGQSACKMGRDGVVAFTERERAPEPRGVSHEIMAEDQASLPDLTGVLDPKFAYGLRQGSRETSEPTTQAPF